MTRTRAAEDDTSSQVSNAISCRRPQIQASALAHPCGLADTVQRCMYSPYRIFAVHNGILVTPRLMTSPGQSQVEASALAHPGGLADISGRGDLLATCGYNMRGGQPVPEHTVKVRPRAISAINSNKNLIGQENVRVFCLPRPALLPIWQSPSWTPAATTCAGGGVSRCHTVKVRALFEFESVRATCCSLLLGGYNFGAAQPVPEHTVKVSAIVVCVMFGPRDRY